jgi:putative ABC transport system ATP-binding protein
VLHLNNIRKNYKLGKSLVPALQGVSLKAELGESWALLGRSGSGKSTLLNIAGLIDDPDQGFVEFEGQRLSSLSENAKSQFRLRKIGFIFQSYHLIPTLNVIENTSLPGTVAKRNRVEVRKQAIELLEKVGLKDLIHRPVQTLSGGQRQRVAIARSLINTPRLILADEPTANLDTQSENEVMKLICELCDSQMTTVIVATHSLEVAEKMKKKLILKDGNLAERLEGTLDRVVQADRKGLSA